MRSAQYTTRNGQSLVSNPGFRGKVKGGDGPEGQGAERPGSLGAVHCDTVGKGRRSKAPIIRGYWQVQAPCRFKVMDIITRDVENARHQRRRSVSRERIVLLDLGFVTCMRLSHLAAARRRASVLTAGARRTKTTPGATICRKSLSGAFMVSYRFSDEWIVAL